MDTEKFSAPAHHPEVAAGDPFYAEAQRQDPQPHGCYEGWVYLGFETEEDGELVEATDRVRCRRCERGDG